MDRRTRIKVKVTIDIVYLSNGATVEDIQSAVHSAVTSFASDRSLTPKDSQLIQWAARSETKTCIR